MNKKHKISVINLGCPRNITDSETIVGGLTQKGYAVTDITNADTAIINTCSFIEEAKKESIDAILDLISLKKEGKLKRIIVSGCLVQRYKDKLRKELPEVDAFIGRQSLNYSSKRFSIIPKYYAYLKICESCVNNCSYCIIPKIKGKFESLSIEEILKKAEAFNAQKISELNIIGQDISGYGIDIYGEKKLPKLLRHLVKKTKNIGWIRLLYLYPDPIIGGLLDLMKEEERICKYIDLPIQHINNRILKLMNRRVTKEDILRLVANIRKRIPLAVIRTSLIVGFPTETDKEFKELANFIEEIKFERLGVFTYSREESTLAYDYKPQIPEKIKIERFNEIMSRQQEISTRLNKKFLGKEINVLIEEKENDCYLARSEYDAPEVDGLVYVKTVDSRRKEFKIGDFVKVKITDTLEYDLVGQPL